MTANRKNLDDLPAMQVGKRLMVPKDKLMAGIDRQAGEDEGRG